MLTVLSFLAVVFGLALIAGRMLAYCEQMTPRAGERLPVKREWWSLEE